MEVTVTDGTDPLENAAVVFTDYNDVGVSFTGTTNSSGKCTIEVPLEKYDVTATCAGYVDYEHPSQITVSGDTTLTIEMEIITDTLTITVNDGENVISGATVTIGSDEQTTGEDGVATFTDMPYDDYSVTVEADGYATATETLQFRSNHKSFTVSLTATGGTGTVTVTCQDSTQNPITDARVYLSSHSTFDWENIPSELEYVVGGGMSDETTGIATLYYNDGTQEPTSTDIPFGSYYLYAQSESSLEEYSGTLVVDGDETVTITLTPIDAEQNG